MSRETLLRRHLQRDRSPPALQEKVGMNKTETDTHKLQDSSLTHLEDTLRTCLGTRSSDPGCALSVRGRFTASLASEDTGIVGASDSSRASSVRGHGGSSIRMEGLGGARPLDPSCVSPQCGGTESSIGSEGLGGTGSADSGRAAILGPFPAQRVSA
jgi:hypothetical protein